MNRSTTPPRPIVIDTDAGWDDWLALLFLMKCPQVRILGVTVTGVGVAHLTPGMAIMNELLVFGGQAANVYPGSQKPLVYSNAFPGSFRATMDSLMGLTVPPPPGTAGTSSISTTRAVDYLHQTFLEGAANGAPVDVLSIGGFTNLGTLLSTYPLAQYRAGIGTIYAMAGAIDVPGNVVSKVNGDDPWSYYGNNTRAEWNVFIDVQGAQVVLTSGLRIVLVPLDATNCVPVTKEFVSSYGQRMGTDRYAEFVYQLLKDRGGTTSFFDPLAAAVLVTQADAALVTVRAGTLQIATELNEEENTVGELTATTDPRWSPLTICSAANQATFETLLSQATLPARPAGAEP
jgi:pyrimidine-specific ribonucleoside hydrolase